MNATVCLFTVAILLGPAGCNDDDTMESTDARVLDTPAPRPDGSRPDASLPDAHDPAYDAQGDAPSDASFDATPGTDASMTNLYRCQAGICGEAYYLCIDKSAEAFVWHDCICRRLGECP